MLRRFIYKAKFTSPNEPYQVQHYNKNHNTRWIVRAETQIIQPLADLFVPFKWLRADPTYDSSVSAAIVLNEYAARQ